MKRIYQAGFFLLITGLLFFASHHTYSQQPSLSVVSISLPDTIYEGLQYQVSVVISNSSNSLFNDSLYVLMQEDTTASNPDTLLITFDSISAGTLKTFLIPNHFFTQQHYKAGGNTVVVWPVGKNAATIDSLQTGFFYVLFNTIAKGPESGQNFDLYPNPARDVMYMEGKNLAGYVRIFDLEGRTVYDRPFTGRMIYTGDLTRGVYFLELRDNRNKKSTRRFLKL